MLSQLYLDNTELTVDCGTPFFYRTPLVSVSALYRLLFCAILAQADQDKTVWVIFLQNHCCILRANIAQVIFLCNVVSDRFGQH